MATPARSTDPDPDVRESFPLDDHRRFVATGTTEASNSRNTGSSSSCFVFGQVPEPPPPAPAAAAPIVSEPITATGASEATASANDVERSDQGTTVEQQMGEQNLG